MILLLLVRTLFTPLELRHLSELAILILSLRQAKLTVSLLY